MMGTQRIGTKLRAWLPVLPLALLLLASYWLSLQVQPLASKAGEQRHDVDFVVDKLTTTTLNQEGQPRITLAADKMWHYPDDDTTHLQMPHLTSFFADRPPSRISAQSGTLSSRSDDLYLYDEVQVVRPAGPDTPEQRFQTDYLHVAPERDWADTDHPILLLSGKSTISAIGMELDNKAGSVKLLSRVRASHEPVRN